MNKTSLTSAWMPPESHHTNGRDFSY
jgi:hypothetical protein